MNKQITIIGGGIAGLTAAIALNKKGINTILFESTPEIRALGAGLGLGANAMMAFNYLGIMDEVVRLGKTLSSFSIFDQKGKLITVTDSRNISAKFGIDNFTIHRAALHQLLSSKIDSTSLHTSKRVIDIEQNRDSVVIKFQDGTTYVTEYLIVADGIHSSIRKKLLPDTKPRYAGYTCWRAVIDNSNLNISESSETWGAAGRFGIVPLVNRKIYWFACVNSRQNNQKLRNFKAKDILSIFNGFHEPIPSILRETKDENILWNDIIDLKPIKKYAYKNILLIGDAAHATTPNLGQGACQAIEDGVILANELAKNDDVKTAFIRFENRRLERTHNIINTSWKVGKIAQIENRFLIIIRNFIFRKIPSSVNERNLEKLYSVDFKS